MKHTKFLSYAAFLLCSALLVSFLVSCTGETEVTTEMIADANSDIDQAKMPEYRKWKMDETESGIRFYELNRGDGARPSKGDTTVVDYNLWLTNGKLIDSSTAGANASPFSFKVGTGRVIDGWDEIVLLMTEGSRFLVEIPPDLGYGKQAVGPIPKNSRLVFSIDLVDVK